MYIAVIFLFIANILFLVFFYFKLQRRFSDESTIANIRKEASKLIGDIAFQTDRSVRVLEEKFTEVNKLLADIDRRILLAEKEEEKRAYTERVLKDLENSIPQAPQAAGTKSAVSDEAAENGNAESGNMERPAAESGAEPEPIKIYTKQLLLNKNGGMYQKENVFYDQIIEMAKKGLSVELIAEKVPLSAGEIELIVSLNT